MLLHASTVRMTSDHNSSLTAYIEEILGSDLAKLSQPEKGDSNEAKALQVRAELCT